MRKLTHKEFVDRARAVHGDTYEYPEEYAGAGVPITVVCKTHGPFKQAPNPHVSHKQGCPVCARLSQAKTQRADYDEVIRRFRSVHGSKYGYEEVVYTGAHRKVKIFCPEHGYFHQTPQSHMSGRRCPACAAVKQQAHNSRRNARIAANFSSLASIKHGTAFDYSDTTYTHNQAKITFRCVEHDTVLTQTARDHLDGYNPCPRCNHMKSSGEAEVLDYLSIFTPAEARNRSLIKPKEVDIYLPEKAIAVEYCGEYWHSHGDREDERLRRMAHYQKYIDCKAKGVRLLTIFESEWKEHNYAIRRLLRNAVGKSKGRLMARKCEMKEVPNKEATAFYNRYHPQGGTGSGRHYGLYWNGKLVACMRFAEGANDRGKNTRRTWTLTRYATRVTIAGGASRLFKAFLEDVKPTEVKSFSDNRYFGGSMYEQLGFVLEEETGPDYYVWHAKTGVLPKAAWQRRNIPARAKEVGIPVTFDPKTDPRTEREMTYLLNGRRLFDCGKKRWVYTP